MRGTRARSRPSGPPSKNVGRGLGLIPTHLVWSIDNNVLANL